MRSFIYSVCEHYLLKNLYIFKQIFNPLAVMITMYWVCTVCTVCSMYWVNQKKMRLQRR